MSEYQEAVKQWCMEIMDDYQAINDKSRESIGEQKLQDWEHQLQEFTEKVNHSNTLNENEIYQRGNELASQLESYLNETGDGAAKEEDDRITNAYQSVPIGGHRLPALPYRYDALEPYISEEIMRLHHDKHHRSYVEGLNKAEREMQKARTSGDFDLIKHWEREAAFNGAGHYLHTIFWNNMTPRGGGEPKGNLRRAINQSFGSFAAFKNHFTEAANHVEGGGWAILVWSPRSRRLEILQAEKHQNLSQWDVVPILVLDVWEHAYYLDYKNEKKKYIDNWWNLVNWQDAGARFNEAQKLRWQPF